MDKEEAGRKGREGGKEKGRREGGGRERENRTSGYTKSQSHLDEEAFAVPSN